MLCPKIIPARYETRFRELPFGACFVVDQKDLEGEILIRIDSPQGVPPGAVRLRDGKFLGFHFGMDLPVHRVDLQADTVGDLW